MTETTPASFTKEQLFAELEKDGITATADVINKAKNGDAVSMNSIGYEYKSKKLQYDKAMAWYRLAALKNNSAAQNNIGVLYGNGYGVPTDYLLAITWYLKSAIQNEKVAWGHIGSYFEHGLVVPVNKYKALEWYTKSENKQDRVKVLTDQGIQLTEQDKMKTTEQLVMETEDIFWSARRTKEDTLKEEIKSLKESKIKLEEESRAKDDRVKSLEEENQTMRDTSEVKQQELEQHKSKEQAINNEMQTLKQANSTQELKLEIKDNKISSLENEVKLLRVLLENLPQSTAKRIDLLEQERKAKESEFELIKQKMEFLSEIVKQLRGDSLNDSRTVKRKMIDVSTSSRKKPSTASNSNVERNGCNNRREDATSEDTEYNKIKIESDDNDNDIK